MNLNYLLIYPWISALLTRREVPSCSRWELAQRIKDFRVLRPKWEGCIKALPSRLMDLSSIGARKSLRAIVDG